MTLRHQLIILFSTANRPRCDKKNIKRSRSVIALKYLKEILYSPFASWCNTQTANEHCKIMHFSFDGKNLNFLRKLAKQGELLAIHAQLSFHSRNGRCDFSRTCFLILNHSPFSKKKYMRDAMRRIQDDEEAMLRLFCFHSQLWLTSYCSYKRMVTSTMN